MTQFNTFLLPKDESGITITVQPIKFSKRSRIMDGLRLLQGGTNSNWETAIVVSLSNHESLKFTASDCARIIARILSNYLDGVPADLRMTVRQKLTNIIGVLIVDIAQAEAVEDMVREKLKW